MTTFRTRFTFRVDTWTPDGESIVEHMGGPGRASIGQPNLKARRRRVVLTMIGIVEVAFWHHPPFLKSSRSPRFSSRTRFRSPFRAKRTGNCAWSTLIG
jgi:hypothetical protein